MSLEEARTQKSQTAGARPRAAVKPMPELGHEQASTARHEQTSLGGCAAEGLKNDPPKFGLSESRRLDFFDVAKGSATPEIATFFGNGLLPRRLLGGADLLGQALAGENRVLAWKRVKANKGSAGVDRRTVLETGEYLKQAWPDIRAQLLDGSYRPDPVRRIGIPKPGGGTRELGIPTVVDRLIQQALLQVLQPLMTRRSANTATVFDQGEALMTRCWKRNSTCRLVTGP